MFKKSSTSFFLFTLTFLFFLFVSNSIYSQNFPQEVSSKGLVLEGKIENRTTEWSADHKTIYTINWIKTKALFQGQTNNELIPVLTLGGETEEGLLVVSHALNLHRGYDYLLALEPCTDCLVDKTSYLIKGAIADFNPEVFLQEKINWQRKPNMVENTASASCKGIPFEIDELHVQFGDIYITDLENKLAYIDILTRTTEYPKALHAFSTEVAYDPDFFGYNAVSSSAISPSTIGTLMTAAYNIMAIDLTAEKAKLDLERKTNATSFFMVDTTYQNTLRVAFSYANMDINNLPATINELFALEALTSSFYCGRQIYSFDMVKVEDRPIGVVVQADAVKITYTMENVQYLPQINTLLFDVYASSDSEEVTELQSANIVFNYNTNAFLPDQVTENLVTVTPTNTDYVLAVDDLSASSFQIKIGEVLSNPAGNNFTLITKTPTKLARVNMTVDDCEEAPNLKFNFSSMVGGSFFRDVTIPIIMVQAYSPVVAFDEENIPPCGCEKPEIFSFTPDEIIAGDNQVLTITGNHFGVFERGLNPGWQGDGSSVLFINGDYIDLPSNPSTIPEYTAVSKLDFTFEEILEWRNTQIKVRVPSSSYQKGINGPAATGKFIVRRGCGKEDKSPEQVNIPYALMNYRVTTDGYSRKLGLRNFNGPNQSQNGYEFEINEEVSNSLRTAFDDALDTWCNATSIRFKKGKDNPNNIDAQAGDDINSVSVEDLATENAEAAVIVGRSYFQIDCINSDFPTDGGYIMTDLDIVIDKDFALTGSSDRKLRVLEHELGHAHMINHALCTSGSNCGPLMHPQGKTEIQAVDITGAKRVFENSRIISESFPCKKNGNSISVSPISVGECGWVDAITDPINLNFEVYPNPSSGLIAISNLPNDAFLSLFDIMGKKILTKKTKSNLEHLDLNNLAEGTYILYISNSSAVGQYKIIIQ